MKNLLTNISRTFTPPSRSTVRPSTKPSVPPSPAGSQSLRSTTASTGKVFVEWFEPDLVSTFDDELDAIVSAAALEKRQISGWCNVCGASTTFAVTSDVLRETFVCSHDSCIGRYRAIAAALSQEYFDDSQRDLSETIAYLAATGKRVYLTETNTSVYRRFRAAMPAQRLDVSEFFGDDVLPGTIVDGIRHENLERTSFADGTFDLIVTSEVMEHVPDAIEAEREIVRLLRPGGVYAFTVPLDPAGEADTILSEKRADGTIVHFGEPVYHGDPSRPEGVLAYRIFAVRAMERRFRALRCDFVTYRLWSKTYGILGNYAWVHVVRKSPAFHQTDRCR